MGEEERRKEGEEGKRDDGRGGEKEGGRERKEGRRERRREGRRENRDRKEGRSEISQRLFERPLIVTQNTQSARTATKLPTKQQNNQTTLSSVSNEGRNQRRGREDKFGAR
ncbi:hypothetical protein Pcinc_034777 [Petrolisthes cinctipes]|uniref:Uncharacterized protein n=1 Tax=Petrolisthes cinctipes TaxID=88211 RepID=A0AAE1C0Y7_PETCI|nr:hypothetical protein Pcinc_034777 [Petrolisthes cinctipes]